MIEVRDTGPLSEWRFGLRDARAKAEVTLRVRRLGLGNPGEVRPVDEGIWIVSFMSDDLGFIDLEQKTLPPIDNPFGPRLSPMS